MLQTIIHYGVHVLVPLVVALLFFKSKWKIVFLVMLSTFIIDLDHLLANPIYDATRCSINFHPLHTFYAIGVYVLLVIPKKTRIVGLGLCIHIFADCIDCLFI